MHSLHQEYSKNVGVITVKSERQTTYNIMTDNNTATKKRQRSGILLASFINTDDEDQILQEVEFIAANANLTNNYIFLLRDKENPQRKIITYNVAGGKQEKSVNRLFTLRVHRKKQTNTLYTINALNTAIAKEHNGQTGKHLKLNWEEYQDSLLMTSGKELAVYHIEVVKIFKIEDPPEEN
tara:strand:- start:3 stop:545 length:543 start_codon:yes stop_codon:yes gene_type:complete